MNLSINDYVEINGETWKILDLYSYTAQGQPQQLVGWHEGSQQMRFNVSEITRVIPRSTVKRWRAS